ncbi:MAG TPA: twin-arginine translocation signal domain-containing protein [Planctomycetota bacterium]|nr:twin-arginine translocation signal domain-containing protein [Planctomycetota bacterium]
MTRRDFVRASAAAAACSVLPAGAQEAPRGDRPPQARGVRAVNPRARVPVSLLVDDSTCLVNLAHFCIPQFAHVWPDRYRQDWRSLPREIPDAFVRKFGEWCRERGVKGKYSVIPYPACVGWIDRELPGWTKRELDESLRLLRDFMARDWDFTPEMVTHTRMVDVRTGKPVRAYDADHMENTWSAGKSADQLAEYCAYALRAVKDAGLECQGVTSPGGFAGRSLPAYSQAVLQACRDVYGTEIPFYLKKVHTDERSVAPEVLLASDLEGPDPKVVVSIIGCTGDWFGGWDGLTPGNVDLFITEDLRGGRLPQVIDRGEPAVLVCHWPGIYYNGEELGFRIFQEVVRRLHARYDHLIWMKFSEIARAWAARELTPLGREGTAVTFQAPFACPDFTVEVAAPVPAGAPRWTDGRREVALREVARRTDLVAGTWTRAPEGALVCFDLPKGASRLEWA